MLKRIDKPITEKEKKRIKGELARYRDYNKSIPIGKRLKGVPTNRTAQLFGVNYFPCTMFGKQLVLKIIDELLEKRREK